ncbi:MAG: hypothetical protein AAGI37_19515 [Planctomycetota bacterium]
MTTNPAPILPIVAPHPALKYEVWESGSDVLPAKVFQELIECDNEVYGGIVATVNTGSAEHNNAIAHFIADAFRNWPNNPTPQPEDQS